MIWLVYPGALITLVGLTGIVMCIFKARKARDAADDPAAMQRLLQRLLILNMGSLMTAMFGLTIIVVGLFL